MSWFSGTDADDWSASGATNELNTDLFKEVHSSKKKKKKDKSKDGTLDKASHVTSPSSKNMQPPSGESGNQNIHESPTGQKKQKRKRKKKPKTETDNTGKDSSSSPSVDNQTKKRKRKLGDDKTSPGGEGADEKDRKGDLKKRNKKSKLDVKDEVPVQAKWLMLQRKLEGLQAKREGSDLNKKEKDRIRKAAKKTKVQMAALESKMVATGPTGGTASTQNQEKANSRNKYKDFEMKKESGGSSQSKAGGKDDGSAKNLEDLSTKKKKKKKKCKNKFKMADEVGVGEKDISPKGKGSPKEGGVDKSSKRKLSGKDDDNSPMKKKKVKAGELSVVSETISKMESPNNDDVTKKKKKRNAESLSSPMPNSATMSKTQESKLTKDKKTKGETSNVSEVNSPKKKKGKKAESLTDSVKKESQPSKQGGMSGKKSKKQKVDLMVSSSVKDQGTDESDNEEDTTHNQSQKKKKINLVKKKGPKETQDTDIVLEIKGKPKAIKKNPDVKLPFDVDKLKAILSTQKKTAKTPGLGSKISQKQQVESSDSESSDLESSDLENSDSESLSEPEVISKVSKSQKNVQQKVQPDKMEIDSDEEEKMPKTKVDRSSALKAKMEGRLTEARFRYLNQQLYTCTGDEALTMFKEDNSAFKVYHQGFQSQVEKWPTNPVDVIINYIKTRPNAVVADFGCGDAKIARSVENKVHSFDLVALNKHVKACDMSHVPLGNCSVDIAVFCLSLMGTNLLDYLMEARRVLKKGGILKVAEVQSRIPKLNKFIFKLEALGFELMNKDVSNKMFVLLELKRTGDQKKQTPDIELLPCYYKKR